MSFTKNKFQRLPLTQQHKKCSEILRLIYEQTEKTENFDLTIYNQLLHWMNSPLLENNDFKSISDRYHFHLQMAGCSLKEHNLLPSLRNKDIKAKENFPKDIAIYLDNLRSAYNVGSILRTCEAFRLGNIYFSKKTPFIDNKKVIKTAMGTSPIVPCFQDIDINKLPHPLIGLDTSDMAVSLYDFEFPAKFTLILGNEEYGISDKLLQQLDYIMEIPMAGCKNSINVACAFAIAASMIKKKSISQA